MSITDLQKEKNRRYQANKRARDRGLPEPYPLEDPGLMETRRVQHERNLLWAQSQVLTGTRYKSEARSCIDLLGIYEGGDVLNRETDEDEGLNESLKKIKRSQINRPNPSQQKIVIRAVTYNGILLEPNCDKDFRNLNEVDEVVSFERWLDLRDRARKDLLWLGRLLGYGLFHSVHRYVCNQFVQKNFGGAWLKPDGSLDETKEPIPPMYEPGFTLDDFHTYIGRQVRTVSDIDLTPCKEMVLLESRGAYKSTIDGIDAIQWLINCPDIRIMIITGVKSLAKKFAKQIKRSFYLPAKGIPTAFHLLFPEYVLTGIDGRSESPLDCPAAFFNQKESNLWVSSIESSNTGDHCDIKKADDVVTSKNSTNQELRESLKFEFDGTDDVLDPWGFSDVAGTRYFTVDWYGTRAMPDEDTNEVAPYRYSCRGAWTLPAEIELLYKEKKISLKEIIDKKLGTLTFPYKLGWGELRRILNKKGERSFKNQQLNEATDAKDDSVYINQFDEDTLRAHSYPKTSAPQVGDIFQSWDWSYSDNKTSDYSVGITAMVYQRKDGQYALCILEIIYDKWKSSELVLQIISFHRKWNPRRVLVEAANGIDLLEDNLRIHAQRLGSTIMHDLFKMPVSLQPNAKRNRVKTLETLLHDDRLWFVNGPWIDETFKQLVKYNGAKSTATRKDDIPDGMAYLSFFLPRASLIVDSTPEEVEKEVEKIKQEEERKAWHNRMFGGQYQAPPPQSEAPPTPEDPRRAAMNRIFGGNGMHG